MSRLTSKGQVTVPKEMRDKAGLLPGTEVEFELEGDAVSVRRATDQTHRGREIVEHLRAAGAGFTMTTDEIMALTRGED